MGKNRLEDFSDSVITIMVLEPKVPHGASSSIGITPSLVVNPDSAVADPPNRSRRRLWQN
jgi:hypothetical protein